MIISSIINILFETLLSSLLSTVTWISTQILDDSITVFKSGNFFDQILSIISFNEELYIPQIIRGIAFGLVLVFTAVSLLQSMASPMIGEQRAVNPAKVIVRTGITIFMLFAIFGFSFGSTINYGGLLSTFGNWFGSILANLGEIIKNSNIGVIATTTDSIFRPSEYVGAIILTFTLCISVFGAALNYIDRIVSLAVYTIMGPIAVSMYASPDTEQTAKDWAMGLLTQFLSIFLSLILWNAYTIAAANAFKSDNNLIFGLAVTTAILGLMRNSEKILNGMGLRTMTAGDTMRAVTAGMLGVGSALAIASRSASLFGKAKGGGTNKAVTGNVPKSQYDKNGNLSNAKGFNFDKNSAKVNRGSKLSNELAKNGAKGKYDASMVNSALGLDKKGSSLKAIGDTRSTGASTKASAGSLKSAGSQRTIGASIKDGSSGQMANVAQNGSFAYREAKAPNGSTVGALMGDFQYTHNGQTQIIKDAFVPVSNANQILTPGTSIGAGTDGTERYIDKGGFIIDNEGHQIYKTTDVAPRFNEGEQPIEDTSDFDILEDDARLDNNEKEIAEIIEHQATNDDSVTFEDEIEDEE